MLLLHQPQWAGAAWGQSATEHALSATPTGELRDGCSKLLREPVPGKAVSGLSLEVAPKPAQGSWAVVHTST